jgi:hypothetical protein
MYYISVVDEDPPAPGGFPVPILGGSMPSTNPISLMADDMLESFADVARMALRVRPMTRERLMEHVLGLLTEEEQQVWAAVIGAAVEKAIRDMQPVKLRLPVTLAV